MARRKERMSEGKNIISKYGEVQQKMREYEKISVNNLL